jgi:hypothetical protein
MATTTCLPAQALARVILHRCFHILFYFSARFFFSLLFRVHPAFSAFSLFQDAGGCSPLMHAAMANNGAGAEALLALGADLCAQSWKNGYTALAWASRCGADAVADLFLAEDARQALLDRAPQLLSGGAPPPRMLSAAGSGAAAAAAGGWLSQGAQVTWRGADEDLPAGTVKLCARRLLITVLPCPLNVYRKLVGGQRESRAQRRGR